MFIEVCERRSKPCCVFCTCVCSQGLVLVKECLVIHGLLLKEHHPKVEFDVSQHANAPMSMTGSALQLYAKTQEFEDDIYTNEHHYAWTW